MHLSDSHSSPTPFRPTIMGCVAQNKTFAHALEGVYLHALYGVASMTYRTLIAERHDRRLAAIFDEIMIDETEHFRLLGDLILALGGNPAICAQIRVERVEPDDGEGRHASELTEYLISQTEREKKRSVDHLQTLMAKAQDRVVRSLLSHLVADEERHLESLRRG